MTTKTLLCAQHSFTILSRLQSGTEEVVPLAIAEQLEQDRDAWRKMAEQLAQLLTEFGPEPRPESELAKALATFKAFKEND